MTVAPRIAWLSPYGSRSDIGAFTRCLLPHFAADAGGALDCDLFVNAYGDTYDSPVPAMEIPAAGSIGEILSRYDSVFFNLGNNAQNHTHIINALRSVAGIAVLHDFSYHHFFAHKCFEELRSPPVYARLLRDYYGSVGFNMALRSGIITREATLYAPWDGENVAQYPLTQPVSALAAAVVVHSKFMEEHVAKTFQGPILRLFLPSDQKKAPSPDEILQWGNETASRERCQFTTFGHISRAKCLDVIVQAIGSSPLLRSRGQLTIAGNASDKEYVREIEALATKLGLIKQVTFEYNVTDERLLAIKNETDVFLNLRYPNTEGASGSLIEMMNAGKPIIAYRSGCYAEVPENAALLLDRREGLDGVVAAMESLVSAPERRIAIGKAAKADLAGRDSASYVRTLKEFAADIRPQSRRRAHYVVPARDGLQWTSRDVLDEDRLWFEELTRARRTFQLLERDRYVQSPDAFLNWSIDDLTNFVGRVLLHADRPSGFGPILASYALRLGRWSFYGLVSRLRRYQALCEQSEINRLDLESFGERVPDVAFWDIATRLKPEIFAKMLYILVLERAWSGDEPDSWARRIRQGMPASAALLEFLSSLEYRQTFADDAMSDVEDWARRESAIPSTRADQSRGRMVWPPSVGIRFNEDTVLTEALLGQFWHRRDGQGRWSNGRTGDLRFVIPDTFDGKEARLVLQIRVAGTRYIGQRKISAFCDNQELASIVVSNDSPLIWTIALPAAFRAKEGFDLLLIADKDFSPAAGGQSTDRRSLGIMLIEGMLTDGVEAALESAAV